MQRYSGFGLISHGLSYHENWQKLWRNPTPKNLTTSSLSAAAATD